MPFAATLVVTLAISTQAVDGLAPEYLATAPDGHTLYVTAVAASKLLVIVF